MHSDPSSSLPSAARALPEVRRGLVHVPDGPARVDPLPKMLQEVDAALAELILERKRHINLVYTEGGQSKIDIKSFGTYL